MTPFEFGAWVKRASDEPETPPAQGPVKKKKPAAPSTGAYVLGGLAAAVPATLLATRLGLKTMRAMHHRAEAEKNKGFQGG